MPVGRSRAELKQLAVQEAIAQWQRFPSDTGSGEVQVAVMTTRINNLIAHMAGHHKDMMSKRRLQMLVLQRNRMLKYLRRSKRDRYTAVLTGLGIRPSRNFDPTIQVKKSKWAGAKLSRQQKRNRPGSRKTPLAPIPYGQAKNAKARTKMARHAARQTRLHKERAAEAKAAAKAANQPPS